MKALDLNVDEQRMVEAAQKDPVHFADLYELHLGRVYAYIIRRVRHRQEAEDLTSEVFHKALANLPGYEWRGTPFASWLFRIAANAITDRWKKTSQESDDPVPDVLDDTTMEEIEGRAMLQHLVKNLPAEQLRVVLLRFTEQKSVREIAQAIGRSEGAVKQLQFRALQTLRKARGDAHG